MVEVEWYYSQDDEQLGPVSPAELKRLAMTGKLSPEDLVWKEGMESWTPARKMKGLFPDSKEVKETKETKEAPKAVKKAEAKPAKTREAPAPAPKAEEPDEEEEEAAEEEAAGGLADLAGAFEAEEAPSPRSKRATGRGGRERSAPASTRGSSSASKTRTSTAGSPVLNIIQGGLWALCGIVVLVGGVLFARDILNAADQDQQAAAGTTYATLFIGAYIVARAGEKIVKLFSGDDSKE